jgi:integrase
MSGLKLIPPRKGKTQNWYIRGTYLGQSVNQSTRTGKRKVAEEIRKELERSIERGLINLKKSIPTFAEAAIAYMNADGERRFLEPLLHYFRNTPLSDIGQIEIDNAAVTLYPNSGAPTRNRQVYSPISAVLKHAGVQTKIKRPKGWRGESRPEYFRRPNEAFALLHAATELHGSFGALCTFLLYTGCRLSEALKLRPGDLDLNRATALVRTTKNGQPRMVHLPPLVVVALGNIRFGEQTVFGFSKGGRLYKLLEQAEERAGVSIPDGIAFHIFRHTYGAWMRRFVGMDTSALIGTGAWKSRQAAQVYEHVDASEEARKADLLPTPTRQQGGGKTVD